jgi:hypothetical protein
MSAAAIYLREHPRLVKVGQVVLVVVVVAFCVWAVRSEWSEAG